MIEVEVFVNMLLCWFVYVLCWWYVGYKGMYGIVVIVGGVVGMVGVFLLLVCGVFYLGVGKVNVVLFVVDVLWVDFV